MRHGPTHTDARTTPTAWRWITPVPTHDHVAARSRPKRVTRRSPSPTLLLFELLCPDSDTMCQHDNTDVERSGHATARTNQR